MSAEIVNRVLSAGAGSTLGAGVPVPDARAVRGGVGHPTDALGGAAGRAPAPQRALGRQPHPARHSPARLSGALARVVCFTAAATRSVGTGARHQQAGRRQSPALPHGLHAALRVAHLPDRGRLRHQRRQPV